MNIITVITTNSAAATKILVKVTLSQTTHGHVVLSR